MRFIEMILLYGFLEVVPNSETTEKNVSTNTYKPYYSFERLHTRVITPNGPINLILFTLFTVFIRILKCLEVINT